MQEFEGTWTYILFGVATGLVIGFIVTLAEQSEDVIQLASAILSL